MSPEEWLVGTHLVPANKQLWLWILEEATHIRWKREGRVQVGKQGGEMLRKPNTHATQLLAL
jgi:hypothetical protein